MKTMILATAAVLGLGAGSAFAGEGEGGFDTWFTQRPGAIAQVPVQQTPSAVARNQVGGAPAAAYVTSHRSGTWLFAPSQGGNG